VAFVARFPFVSCLFGFLAFVLLVVTGLHGLQLQNPYFAQSSESVLEERVVLLWELVLHDAQVLEVQF
jgi:hypothetical protein